MTTTKTAPKKKAVKKAVLPKPTLYPIGYEVEQLPGCCGIGVVCSFTEERERSVEGTSWNSYGRYKQLEPTFFTKEEAAQDVYTRFMESTGEDDDAYTTLVITLVTKYADGRDAQFPQLGELLIKYGWQVNQQFINPNHGNEVTMYSCHFPERVTRDEDDDEDEE